MIPHNNICPNCGSVLSKETLRKTKCPECSKYIYIRDGVSVSEEDVFVLDWMKYVDYLVPDIEKIIQEVNNKLTKKFGKKPSANDLVWGVFNHLILILSQNKDKLGIGTVYRQMANYVEKEGKTEYAKELRNLSAKFEKEYFDEMVDRAVPSRQYDKKEVTLSPNKSGAYNCVRCDMDMGEAKKERKLFGKDKKYLYCNSCKLRYDIQ